MRVEGTEIGGRTKPKPPTQTAAEAYDELKEEVIGIQNTKPPAPKPVATSITATTPKPPAAGAGVLTGAITGITATQPATEKPIEETKPIDTPVEQPVPGDEDPSVLDMINQMNEAIKSDISPHYHPNMVPISEEEMNEPIITEKA